MFCFEEDERVVIGLIEEGLINAQTGSIISLGRRVELIAFLDEADKKMLEFPSLQNDEIVDLILKDQ